VAPSTPRRREGSPSDLLPGGAINVTQAPLPTDQAGRVAALAGQRVAGHTAPIDLAVLAGFRELQEPGGADIVTEFIDLFLADLAPRLVAIRKATTLGDPEPVRAAAHALKSASAYVGALELSRKCMELEAAAKARDLEQVLQLSEEVAREAGAVQEILRRHRVTSGPGETVT
jgi:HPt (histidine-containing phosphotransfer) domain-containing protein